MPMIENIFKYVCTMVCFIHLPLRTDPLDWKMRHINYIKPRLLCLHNSKTTQRRCANKLHRHNLLKNVYVFWDLLAICKCQLECSVAYTMLLNLNPHQSVFSKSQPFIDTGADLWIGNYVKYLSVNRCTELWNTLLIVTWRTLRQF